MSALRFTFATLLGAVTLSGCLTKEEVKPDPTLQVCPGPQELLTRWNWQQSSGGIAGGTQTPASTGQTRAIEFDNAGNVRYYTNGQLTRTATYTLQTGTSIRTNQPTDLIVYSSGLRQSYRLQGQQLLLWDEVYDGFSSEYQR